ncbi:MAG: phosphatidylserine decarboxylase [Deferribacterales bacterium]|nr:phosphatidylserine decarboxylase [Deferribacterales bacterium]
MIAKEGFPFILGAAAVLLILLILPKFLLIALALVVLALFIWFFRDPERNIPADPNVAVSAADGKVVDVAEVEVNGVKYKKIAVFMNIFSVHVNRVPFTGTVKSIEHIAGKFINAAKKEASIENERNIVTFSTSAGDIVVVQVAGLVARRTVCNAKVGDVLSSGDRFGMIKFSSRVDHYFPLSFDVKVAVDDLVKAGESVIAVYEGAKSEPLPLAASQDDL